MNHIITRALKLFKTYNTKWRSLVKALPLVYYPSTTCWIDDNNSFLNTITQNLEVGRTLKYTSPMTFINDIRQNTPTLESIQLIQSYENHDEFGTNHNIPTETNLLMLSKLISNPEKLNDISVIIVDHHMPEMTGLDLCRLLKQHPAKKILLTGEDEESLAIDAFNEGVIHCYLRKDTPTLINNLNTFIESLSKEYFRNLTHHLSSHIEIESLFAFTDPAFAKYFSQWCIDNGVKEYYLIDKNGSTLAFDKAGKQYHFIVHTDKSLDDFYELYDDTNAEDVLALIKSRQRIPFFGFGNEAWKFETNEWNSYLYEPKILNGRTRYYIKEFF